MRLTTVDQMTLPPGRVLSFEVRLDDTRQPLPISFDQRRHVSLGDRPASWMALAIRLPSTANGHRDRDRDRVGDAWLAAVRRHGTLSTFFSMDEDGELRLDAAGINDGVWHDHGEATSRPQRIVREVLDAACSPFQTPSYRLCLVEPDDGSSPIAVLGADHAHVDIWSLSVLARDLLTALADLADGRLPDLPAAEPFAAHTSALEAAPPAPVAVRERWEQIIADGGGAMPRFPLPLGDERGADHADIAPALPAVVEVRDIVDAAGLARIVERAQRRESTLIASALGVLTEVSQRLAGAPLRAVFPVHSRSEERWRDSVGWYITNSVIECSSPDPQSCAAALKEALVLGSYPLAPIFSRYGGMPERPGMFALSWLDVRRLPVALDPQWEAQWVSASMVTDGVMIWFVVDHTGMHIRCRYPDTPEARRNVGRWLDDVQSGLAELAEPRRLTSEPAEPWPTDFRAG